MWKLARRQTPSEASCPHAIPPATLRAQRAGLDPAAQLEHWDPTAKFTFDRALLNELAALRFLDSHHDVTMVY